MAAPKVVLSRHGDIRDALPDRAPLLHDRSERRAFVRFPAIFDTVRIHA